VLKVYFLNPEKLKKEDWMCGSSKEFLNVQNIMDWACSSWSSDDHPKIPKFEQTDSKDKADVRVEFSGG